MSDTVLTCGTFDLFHQGHLNLLIAAKKMGKRLIVGVSSDFLNISKKNRLPINPLYMRYRMITELKCVDQVFIEDDISLEAKARYMQYYAATVFVIGDDWYGQFDNLPYVYEKLFPDSKTNISVIYISRTPNISTTDIIGKICGKSYTKYEFDYTKSMMPQPCTTLLNYPKLPYKVIFNCRNRPHQAVHLLPYYYLFEPQNVYWYIENVADDADDMHALEKIMRAINNSIGFEIPKEQIITSLLDVCGLDIKLAMFTELWQPIVLFYKKVNIKVYFIDHGICVGTRTNTWFANVWQNDVDKIIVSGNMQHDHHLYCSGKLNCHSQSESNIYKLYGYPKLSLFSPCDWIWDIHLLNGETKLKKILIAPTSFFDNYTFILNNIIKLCKKNIVVIRPHPDTMEMANPSSELLKIFMKCMDMGCSKNLIIIPPNNNFLTMNLFTCDIAIFDQSSVVYEYLLFDKPGLLASLKLEESVTPDIRCAFSQIDPSTNYNIEKLYYIMRDPLHLKERRKKMREYVFGGDNWMENFTNLVKNDMENMTIMDPVYDDIIEHAKMVDDINFDEHDINHKFYKELRQLNSDLINNNL